MTDRQLLAAEVAFRKLLRRVRRHSAATSKRAVAAFDAVVRQAANALSDARLGKSVLTQAEADRLLAQVASATKQLGLDLATITEGSKARIFADTVTDHLKTNFDIAKIADLPTEGVAIRLSTAPADASATLNLIRGGKSVRSIAIGHAEDVNAAIGDYIEAAIGKRPSVEALRGIQRILQGDLPVDIAGIDASTAKMGASLGWKGERLIATESYEGYRQVNAEALADSVISNPPPDAEQTRMIAHWELSDRHVGRDICDEIAEGGETWDGKPGWYEASVWPRSPHANCGCFQGDIKIVPA